MKKVGSYTGKSPKLAFPGHSIHYGIFLVLRSHDFRFRFAFMLLSY